MPTLTLIRGLPGSGKSTIARKLLHEYMNEEPVDWYEADSFFENPLDVDVYHFDAALLKEAHDWCYLNTFKSLRDSFDVIVSNTFTRNWEMARYINLVDKVEDLTIKVIEVKTQFESIHGVPADKMVQMQARWQNLPDDFPHEITVIE